MLNIGVIGYGDRISAIVDIMLNYKLGVRIAAIADIELDKVRAKLEKRDIDVATVSLYTVADEMLAKESLDGVLIGTRCSLHTTMALKVMARNLPLYLEKPVATNLVDLELLAEANKKSTSEVVVSFPLRLSTIVTLVKQVIDSGRLGAIEHVQAVNNVPYGSAAYFHSWYRDVEETGGMFLQKATHDLDYINYLLGIQPVSICAVKSKRVFDGRYPAGKRCAECEEYETCPESPFIRQHVMRQQSSNKDWQCAYGVDAGNEDSGSALIVYETGMHVSYSQNFYVKNSAAVRGARLIGEKGTLAFDWYKDEIKIAMHDSLRTEVLKMNSGDGGHGGGDEVLCYNFINIMRGKETSKAPLDAGILSALMCVRARESAETETFRRIAFQE